MSKIKVLLEYFSNETEKGKLYINYPMVESIRYYKNALPDLDYYKYTVSATVGGNFKELADNDSKYKNLDFLCAKIKKYADLNQNDYKKIGRIPSEDELNKFRENWHHVTKLNVYKANFICTQINDSPTSKEDVSQTAIFRFQMSNYI